MATLLGEAVGETVGYRMRLDTQVGPRTRIEVVTEGILTRQLQRDPALDGVGCVIFDEYHERSLQADLGLALTLDCQRHLREDLRLLVMSATLDTAAVARLLDTEAVVTSEGLSHPVTTHYLPRTPDQQIDRLATATVLRALREETGDLLVFLPGAGEIRRIEGALAQQALPADHHCVPAVRRAGRRSPGPARSSRRATGQRKIVLATNIAETSLTIEGVRVVIDAGLKRRSRFYPGSGMSRLETVRISRASADQRRGRAGRLGPGVCYRLWTETDQRALKPHTPAEILEADLAPLALDLAAWGTEASALAWLDAPPAATLAQARDLLGRLQALGEDGRINAHGREMARLSMHPRLAHLLLRAKEAGIGATGCALAALLGERDILRGRERDADIRHAARAARRSPHPDADMAGTAPGTTHGGVLPPPAGRCRYNPRHRCRRVAARLRLPGSHRAHACGSERPLPTERRARRLLREPRRRSLPRSLLSSPISMPVNARHAFFWPHRSTGKKSKLTSPMRSSPRTASPGTRANSSSPPVAGAGSASSLRSTKRGSQSPTLTRCSPP